MEEKAPEPSFYEQLCSIDIVDPILELFMKGQMKADLDGRFRLHRQIGLNRTWTFTKPCPDRKCGKWLGIYHKQYRILPPPCKNCWKVVAAPSTVIDLVEMQKFQTKLGFPAKCGLEKRDYTSGIGGYRAFWYCPYKTGLAGGRTHYRRIAKAMIAHFGEDFVRNLKDLGRFFLKRGCTELERDFGPSDQWDSIDHSAKFNLLETVWEDPEDLTKEFPPLVYTNYKRWIEFAIAHGDQSVLDYLNAKSLGVPSVKYHESKHEEGDFDFLMVPFNGIIERMEKEKKEDGKRRTEKRKGKETDLFKFESEGREEDSGDE